MNKFFTTVFKTATLRQSGATLFATLISGVLGALFYILLARFLGPANFGVLVICITVITLIADAADLGTNTGLIKFVSKYQNLSKEKVSQVLKLSLEIKIISWIIVLILGNILIPPLAENVFQKTELILPLRLSLIGVGGALLFSFATSSLQAFQKFISWGIIAIGVNLVRLIVILLLLFSQQLDLLNSLVAFIVLPFMGFSLSLLFLPTKSFILVSNEKSVLKDLFHYNKWVALFILIAAFSSRLDTFLNAKFLNIYDVGVYGAASQLTSYMPQLVAALGIVAAPKFASFTKDEEMVSYFKKFLLLVLGCSFLGLIILPIAYFLIPIILGSSYLQSRDIFMILFISMLIFLISVPIHTSIFYYFAKPQVFVWVSLGHLLVIIGAGLLLIPTFGMNGTAISVMLGSLFNLFVPLFWIINSLKERDGE